MSRQRISGFVRLHWSSRWLRQPMRRRWRDSGTTRSVNPFPFIPCANCFLSFILFILRWSKWFGCRTCVYFFFWGGGKVFMSSWMNRWVQIGGANVQSAAVLLYSIQKWGRRWASSRWGSKEENSQTLRSWWCLERTVSLQWAARLTNKWMWILLHEGLNDLVCVEKVWDMLNKLHDWFGGWTYLFKLYTQKKTFLKLHNKAAFSVVFKNG